MEYKERKLNKTNIRNSAIETLMEIWNRQDFDKIKGTRLFGIWDEFTNKVRASAMSTNEYPKFVEKLCRKLDVRSLRTRGIATINNQSEEFKSEVLELIREEPTQLILELRLQIDANKKERK